MARYDRLAALSAPGWESALPCWPVLRDLEKDERDADAGRRARLRFLALRPVHRLAVIGPAAVPAESFERQVERVREELGQLPARDAERAVLARFLNELRSRNPDVVVAATLQVSEFAESNGHIGAAEEYARCALLLAESVQRDRSAAATLRVLAHLALSHGHADDAERLARQACDRATAGEDRAEWIRSMGELAAAQSVAGNPGARDVLPQALRRAREWGEEPLVGLALSRLCFQAASESQFDQSVEHGWAALRLLNGGTERMRILLQLGDALVRLNLLPAAERCYSLAAARASDAAVRAAAHTGLALSAASADQRDLFHERRLAAVRELQQTPRQPRAALHVELANAALRVGDVDFAREHVRDALDLLGPDGPRALVQRAESVLNQLETDAAAQLALPTVEVGEQTRRIAAELEQVADSVVAAE
jgi:tetratricopeptide (TPR) repeat protein